MSRIYNEDEIVMVHMMMAISNTFLTAIVHNEAFISKLDKIKNLPEEERGHAIMSESVLLAAHMFINNDTDKKENLPKYRNMIKLASHEIKKVIQRIKSQEQNNNELSRDS